MKSIKNKVINTSLILLGTSFVTAVISDLGYKTVEGAKEYAIGLLLSNISGFLFTLLTMVVLIGGMYEIFFRHILGNMLENNYARDRYEEDNNKTKKEENNNV